MPERYFADETVELLLGDALETLRTLPDESVHCIVTSPPYYGLRDYGVAGQYGLEPTVSEYVQTMRDVFTEARRVLTDDGTLWLNLGDSYVTGTSGTRVSSGLQGTPNWATTQQGFGTKRAEGLPVKSLVGVPWRVAFALQDDGWILRNEIIWHKPSALPESVTDRFSNRFEHIFMLTKQPRYGFDLDAVREPHTAPRRRNGDRSFQGRNSNHARTSTGNYQGMNPNGRNPGNVWEIATRPYPEAHFATMPVDIPIRCIKAGCKLAGIVLDPFSGSGTTGEAARLLGRRYIGIDLNPAYHDLALKRFAQPVLPFAE